MKYVYIVYCSYCLDEFEDYAYFDSREKAKAFIDKQGNDPAYEYMIKERKVL